MSGGVCDRGKRKRYGKSENRCRTAPGGERGSQRGAYSGKRGETRAGERDGADHCFCAGDSRCIWNYICGFDRLLGVCGKRPGCPGTSGWREGCPGENRQILAAVS